KSATLMDTDGQRDGYRQVTLPSKRPADTACMEINGPQAAKSAICLVLQSVCRHVDVALQWLLLCVRRWTLPAPWRGWVHPSMGNSSEDCVLCCTSGPGGHTLPRIRLNSELMRRQLAEVPTEYKEHVEMTIEDLNRPTGFDGTALIDLDAAE